MEHQDVLTQSSQTVNAHSTSLAFPKVYLSAPSFAPVMISSSKILYLVGSEKQSVSKKKFKKEFFLFISFLPLRKGKTFFYPFK